MLNKKSESLWAAILNQRRKIIVTVIKKILTKCDTCS